LRDLGTDGKKILGVRQNLDWLQVDQDKDNSWSTANMLTKVMKLWVA